MLARIDVRGTAGDLRAALARPGPAAAEVGGAVAEIIADVRARGSVAVRELTARLDGADVPEPRVERSEVISALGRISPGLRAAFELARDQIVAWHEAQREREAHHERLGVEVWERVVPVERVGCYVPGGRAPLASSVLMTVLPARVAGVAEVVLCSPPGPAGRIDDAILAAAAIAGADDVFAIGGAQAIAAMAFGAGSLGRVDVIVGPGNAYVVEAKRQVFGTVGIDGLAGASEVAVVADETVDPEWVAADLLAQAEHGPGGAVALIVWDEAVADRVGLALDALLVSADRRDEAAATLDAGGRVIIVDDPAQAIDAANAIAPEHLELMCGGAELLVPMVRNAGAVFVGPHAPAAIGDYVAGTNHVLPTGGTARFASALRIANFQKHIHVVHADAGALKRVGPAARSIAAAEGLSAHADSVRLREESRR
ncbi:MAG TPA: histidinol dehydrogenase [Acidimicrobiia bacterium]|nr:histidinol dehydrogenase [Acidimicrobiia bacterium]